MLDTIGASSSFFDFLMFVSNLNRDRSADGRPEAHGEYLPPQIQLHPAQLRSLADIPLRTQRRIPRVEHRDIVRPSPHLPDPDPPENWETRAGAIGRPTRVPEQSSTRPRPPS